MSRKIIWVEIIWAEIIWVGIYESKLYEMLLSPSQIYIYLKLYWLFTSLVVDSQALISGAYVRHLCKNNAEKDTTKKRDIHKEHR